MDLNYRELDYSQHRLSTALDEHAIFCMDDISTLPYDFSPSSDVIPEIHHRRLCKPQDVALPATSKSHKHRRNSSISSQCGGGNLNGTGRSRRQRRSSEYLEHTPRRSSTCHSGASRSRSHSCTRPTLLGDGRRASVCKKGSISRPRRPSSARRRDSIRPARTGSETTSRLSATSADMALPGMKKEPHEDELARRRHQRITTLLLATFVFILAASVFAVVVTLTHSSFHKPPMGSKELADHRANVIIDDANKQNETMFRKENEELLNSLNRDSSMTENITALSF